MADHPANSELEHVHAQEVFHQREWRVQRLGWAIVAFFIAAACVGVFGNGPLAEQKIVVGDARLELDRFARRHAPAQWRITAKQAPHTSLVVRINADFLNHYRITAISPPPTHTSLSVTHVTFEFDSEGGGDVVFHVDPEQVWISQGEFRIGDSAPIRVSQLVYP
jgi:hypothetical protein